MPQPPPQPAVQDAPGADTTDPRVARAHAMTTLDAADGRFLTPAAEAVTLDPHAEAPAAQASGFAALGLVPPLLAAVDALGFQQPTPVQARAGAP